MLFRIEDTENPDGHLREYKIPIADLPRLKMMELENYLAVEIRKEINNTHDRKLLSYSKSLGVCLLKYNKFTDNELHINTDINTNILCNNVYYFELEDQNIPPKYIQSILFEYLHCLISENIKNEIILYNFQVDVSDNNSLDRYLERVTGIGRKKMASPQKDKEVLLMQSPNDIIISAYSDSVYLLYALFFKYGISSSIYNDLMYQISTLDECRFYSCGESERNGLLMVINYLYNCGQSERKMSQRVFEDTLNSEHLSCYYDPILQLCGIQEDSFQVSYMNSDYNCNIVSDLIWNCYSNHL